MAGIKASAGQLQALADEEAADGIPHSRIAFAGFSQGAAIAMYAGLTHTKQLGCIVALSGYLAGREKLAQDIQITNRQTPILQCHGDSDPLIAPQFALMSNQVLRQLTGAGDTVQMKTYR